jgi:hypothetical protein
VSNSDLERLAPHEDDARDAGAPDERVELVLVVRGAFEEVARQFEPATIEAVRRVLLDGRTVEVVGKELGKTNNAIRIARSRVLGRLRSLLNDIGEPLDATLRGSAVSAELNHGAIRS